MELYNLLELVKIMGLHNHVWIELVEKKYNAMIKERNDLADEVDRLTSHILNDGAFQEWQPIKTAPIDGTRIIVARNELVEPVTEAVWSFVECKFVTPLVREWFQPTHWMPLPSPPQEKQ